MLGESEQKNCIENSADIKDDTICGGKCYKSILNCLNNSTDVLRIQFSITRQLAKFKKHKN